MTITYHDRRTKFKNSQCGCAGFTQLLDQLALVLLCNGKSDRHAFTINLFTCGDVSRQAKDSPAEKMCEYEILRDKADVKW